MSNPSSFFMRRRRVLLSAAAALALVGGIVTGVGLPGKVPVAAHAEVSTTVRPTGFADVVSRVKPAVVAVIVERKAQQNASDDASSLPDLSPDDPLYRFFRQFKQFREFRGGQPPKAEHLVAQGSGFFISGDGYLLTNNHVVEDGAAFKIVADDGKHYAAKLIGRDPRTDLALLKVDANQAFPFVALAKTAPRVGDWVVAIGNPFGLGGTVTAGIVSARGRDIGAGPYDDFLQIDAPVNRGNSGGPSFNLDGEVVGINTAIFSPSGGSVGIGFAIPANVAQTVVAQLQKDGKVVRGWLGVQIQPVTDDIATSLGLNEPQGALVAEVQPDSPAAKAGVKAGDAILTLNGESLKDSRDLQRRVASLAPGSSHNIEVLRNGERLTLNVKFGILPNETAQADTPRDGGATPSNVASLGLTLAPHKDGRGVVVADIDPDGAAATRGLHRGDVILDIGGETVSNPADVKAKLSRAREDGRKIVLAHVRTNGKSVFVPLPVTQG